MEIRQLKYFAAAAELGGFTKAAKRCFVTQPSLSQQIINLEIEIGKPLFIRMGREVRLTPAGETLYNHVKSILNDIESARRAAAGTGDFPEQARSVRVGAIPTIAPYFLPPVLRAFRGDAAEARVVIHEDRTERTIEGCVEGKLDVGIVALPIDEPRLIVESLYNEELILVLHRAHPLALKREIPLLDLESSAFILLDETHCLGKQIVSFCSEKSCNPNIVCKIAQLSTVLELVSVGLGISLVPASVRLGDDDPQRVYRDLSGVRPIRTAAIVYREESIGRPEVARFVAAARAVANEFIEARNNEQELAR
jgi:LysR family hydrogen peroxide-inducible transcriptional activator